MRNVRRGRRKAPDAERKNARHPRTPCELLHSVSHFTGKNDRRSLGRLRGGHFFCPFLFCRSAIFHATSKAPNRTVKIKLSKLMMTAKNVSVSVNVIRHPPFRQSLRGRKLSKVPARSLASFLGTSCARVRSQPPAFRTQRPPPLRAAMLV